MTAPSSESPSKIMATASPGSCKTAHHTPSNIEDFAPTTAPARADTPTIDASSSANAAPPSQLDSKVSIALGSSGPDPLAFLETMSKAEAEAKICHMLNALNLNIARYFRTIRATSPSKYFPRVIETKKPTTLLTLPAEIRNHIWKLLLFNPLLSQSSSVSGREQYGHDTKYGLCPSILGVNKQVNAETESILYGSNVFYVSFLSSSHVGVRCSAASLVLAPLTRYHCARQEDDISSLRDFQEISKVRQWRAVIPLYCSTSRTLLSSLDEFCRTIYDSQPQSLHFGLVPRVIERGRNEDIDLAKLLKPLRMFKGIPDVCIRDCTFAEIPDCMYLHKRGNVTETTSALSGQEALQTELIISMKSRDPVELAFELFPPLLKYAQAFETNKYFKEHMVRSEHISDYYDGGVDERYQNSYQILQNHPVDMALQRAKATTVTNDIESFKKERAFILEYLQPQYERILGASAILNEFVKHEKVSRGIFTTTPSTREWEDPCDVYLVATFLLQQYAKTFKREFPFALELDILTNKIRFERGYLDTKRNWLMDQLPFAIDDKDWFKFTKVFQEAVDDMDSQYLEIRAARRNLFKFDYSGETGCNFIVPELWGCDEMVNWGVNEPGMCPPTQDEAEAERKRERYSHGWVSADAVFKGRSERIARWRRR